MTGTAGGGLTVLVNPMAGGRRASRAARALSEALTAAGVAAAAVRWIDTDTPMQTRQAARDAARAGARQLVVVGGDGTAHHAMQGLLEAPTPIPLALCAAGTGNDFAKNLSYHARRPAEVATAVARGVSRRVDVGTLNGIPFLNAAGAGFDVDVAERMQPGSRRGGRARYLWHAGRALMGYPGFDATWHPAERTRHLMVVFANGHTFGGSFRIAPDARLDDGLLDTVVVGDIPPRDRPRLFFGALRGRHVLDPRVQVHRGTAFHLIAATPLSVECDGELYPLGTCTLQASIRPGALPVLV